MTTETVAELMGWEAAPENPNIKYYWNIAQRSEQWDTLKCGIISASVMKNLLKKKTDKKTGEVTWSVPDTDTTRAHLYELAAQRVNGWTAETFQSRAMERGEKDEVDAFNLYSAKYNQLRTCGFVTNEEHGLVLGYSPDGLTALNDDGQMEAKSRDPKFQMETVTDDEMPDDYMVQVQTGLIVTKRKWCDFVSYAGGMHMFVKRIEPDDVIQYAIIKAAQEAEKKISDLVETYKKNVAKYGFAMTERRVEDITA